MTKQSCTPSHPLTKCNAYSQAHQLYMVHFSDFLLMG